jgi:hypothetical protein
MRCSTTPAHGTTLLLFLLLSSFSISSAAGQQYQKSFDPLDFVDPLIGTAAGGKLSTQIIVHGRLLTVV